MFAFFEQSIYETFGTTELRKDVLDYGGSQSFCVIQIHRSIELPMYAWALFKYPDTYPQDSSSLLTVCATISIVFADAIPNYVLGGE